MTVAKTAVGLLALNISDARLGTAPGIAVAAVLPATVHPEHLFRTASCNEPIVCCQEAYTLFSLMKPGQTQAAYSQLGNNPTMIPKRGGKDLGLCINTGYAIYAVSAYDISAAHLMDSVSCRCFDFFSMSSSTSLLPPPRLRSVGVRMLRDRSSRNLNRVQSSSGVSRALHNNHVTCTCFYARGNH